MKKMVQTLAITLSALSALMTQNLPAAGKPVDTTEGCYARSDLITDLVNGETDHKTSYLSITKKQGKYFIKGFLWGANWHICEISGEEGNPLLVTREKNRLIYSEAYPEEDINCRLEVILKGDTIELKDQNYQCNKSIFACGVRTSIDGTELPRVKNKALCK